MENFFTPTIGLCSPMIKEYEMLRQRELLKCWSDCGQCESEADMWLQALVTGHHATGNGIPCRHILKYLIGIRFIPSCSA